MTQFHSNASPGLNQPHIAHLSPPPVSAGQNWTAYNDAQINEQRIFAQLLRELCDLIPQPFQSGRGRRAFPLSDMVFAVAMKVYSLMSSRRAMTDIHNAFNCEQLDVEPCFNTISAYLRKPEMEGILKQLIEISSLPLKGIEVDFAVDSSGFSTNSYNRWFDHKWGQTKKQAKWVKLHIICGVKTNIITAAEVTPNNASDTLFFEGLVRNTAKNFNMQEVSADKAYLSGPIMEVAHDVGATAFIPFKSNSRYVPKRGTRQQKVLWQQAYYMYQYHRDIFNAHYHKRSNVESTFWMVKSKFGPAVRSKTETGQLNEVLAKIVCHNIVVMVQSMFELGVVPVFEADGLFLQ